MSDVLDRMVRAMRRTKHARCCTGAALDDVVGLHVTSREREMARAALLSVREPTAGMVDAMKGALHEWREGLDSDERMLRHTLRDGKPFHSATEDEKHAIRWNAAVDKALEE